MNPCKSARAFAVVLLSLGALLGFLVGSTIDRSSGQEEKPREAASAPTPGKSGEAPRSTSDSGSVGSRYLRQSPAAVAKDRAPSDYGLGENHASKLPKYPPGATGDRTPLDLWRYAGRGDCS